VAREDSLPFDAGATGGTQEHGRDSNDASIREPARDAAWLPGRKDEAAVVEGRRDSVEGESVSTLGRAISGSVEAEAKWLPSPPPIMMSLMRVAEVSNATRVLRRVASIPCTVAVAKVDAPEAAFCPTLLDDAIPRFVDRLASVSSSYLAPRVSASSPA